MSMNTDKLNPNMNATTEGTDNSQKIESKISNIYIDKKDLKSNRISNIYKDEMTDFQLNDEITFDYETKKKNMVDLKITIEKITPKYINEYKKENMKNINKIENKNEPVLDEEDKEESEDEMEQQHQEQMEMFGYSKCAYCEKELPNDQLGEDDDGDKICLECNSEEEEEEEQEEEEEEETEIQKLEKQKEEIEAKIAEEKYKNEAGMRKEKVVEWIRKDTKNEIEICKKQIEDLKDSLAERELRLSKMEEYNEKEDDELLDGMNVDAVYETITKKKNKTKSGVRKTKGGNGNTTAVKYKAEDIFKNGDKLRQVIDGKEFKGEYNDGEFKDTEGNVFKSLRKWNIHNKEQTNIKSIPDCWVSFKVLNENNEWVRIEKNIENIPDDK
jgi:hypothetical protein